MTENDVIQFGMGEQIVLLRGFLKSGDNTKIAEQTGVSRTFVSQVLNRLSTSYSSKRIECCLFKTAKDNAWKNDVLKAAWIKLFGEVMHEPYNCKKSG